MFIKQRNDGQQDQFPCFYVAFLEYDSNEQRLEKLKAEYQDMLERPDELEQQGFIGAFDKRMIIEPFGDVISISVNFTASGTTQKIRYKTFV